MEAYRYPEDYNGISAMAPANPMVDLMIGTVWTGYAAMKDEAHRLTMSNMMAVQKAFIEQCDARDGLKDGIVADPEDCRFDPASLECKGTPSEGCLTARRLRRCTTSTPARRTREPERRFLRDTSRAASSS